MKKFLLLLIIPLLSFGQTQEEAITFLKSNIYLWSCNQWATGTAIKQLELSLVNENKTLVLTEKLPDINQTNGYVIRRIDLSKITRFEMADSDAPCAAIIIHTKSGGIEIEVTDKFLRNVETIKSWHLTNGWYDDVIRIKNNDLFNERAQRIINALIFLAESNGAELIKSHF